ncbi:hypothetical protein DFH09DRAFT_1103671 [Mycena vulgaris]|nr:hypothetical protein DFH09DRAFT_1103671 [Mycena vulgaris]
MSIYINGIFVRSFSFSAFLPRTTLSSALASVTTPGPNSSYLITTATPRFGAHSATVVCDVLSTIPTDFVLGRDWGAFLRDALLASGLRIGNPNHPIHPHEPAALAYPVPPPGPFSQPVPLPILRSLPMGPSALAPAPPIPPPLSYLPVSNPPNPSRVTSSQFPNSCSPTNKTASTSRASGSKPVGVSLRSARVTIACAAGPSSGSRPPRPDNNPPDPTTRFFTSSVVPENVLIAARCDLDKMMEAHHIPLDTTLSLTSARHMVISHLVSGTCVSDCITQHSDLRDKCGCSSVSGEFSSQKSMAFFVLSRVLCASEAEISDSHLRDLSQCMGAPTSRISSRQACQSFLGVLRQRIVSEHSSQNPATDLFSDLEKVKKGSLLALAQSHGILVSPSGHTRASLRDLITDHLTMGLCRSNESSRAHLSCSSFLYQFQTDAINTDSSGDDPNTRLQLRILTQLCTVLNLKALRRLLDLHNVSYAEDNKLKDLRRRLQGYLHLLKTGNFQMTNAPSLTQKRGLTELEPVSASRPNGHSWSQTDLNAGSYVYSTLKFRQMLWPLSSAAVALNLSLPDRVPRDTVDSDEEDITNEPMNIDLDTDETSRESEADPESEAEEEQETASN